jgi:hypothetical protein
MRVVDADLFARISRLIICAVLQFFLPPSFFISNFSFASVPILEGKKIKCHEGKKRFYE